MRLWLPKLGPISLGLTSVVDRPQGFSTIHGQVSLQGVKQLGFTLPSLPVVTAAVRRAIQRTRDTSATGDDGIGPAFIEYAVSGGRRARYM
jgi:hypothetical protein